MEVLIKIKCRGEIIILFNISQIPNKPQQKFFFSYTFRVKRGCLMMEFNSWLVFLLIIMVKWETLNILICIFCCVKWSSFVVFISKTKNKLKYSSGYEWKLGKCWHMNGVCFLLSCFFIIYYLLNCLVYTTFSINHFLLVCFFI